MIAPVLEVYYLTLYMKVHGFSAYLFCYCQIFTVEDNKIGLLFYMKFYCHLTWNTKQCQRSETYYEYNRINFVTFISQRYGV
jgi:hypothetical protein